MRLSCAARDLLTGADPDRPRVLAFDRADLRLTQGREIVEIGATPPRPEIEALIGARAGGQLRKAINDALPGEVEAGSPLYLLLDDIGVASLVAPFAWSQWNAQTEQQITRSFNDAAHKQKNAGICIGYTPGSSAFDTSPGAVLQHRKVHPLQSPDDTLGWHELTDWNEVSARRSRLIDVWFEDDEIVVATHFQDSAALGSGGRRAVHEYLLTARADRGSATLRAISADPRILPFDVCPTAIFNIDRMIGTPLTDLRRMVVERLPRTDGCTHLNDTIRSLAEVPQLAAALAGSTAELAR